MSAFFFAKVDNDGWIIIDIDVESIPSQKNRQ
jgi:hypothetical protein